MDTTANDRARPAGSPERRATGSVRFATVPVDATADLQPDIYYVNPCRHGLALTRGPSDAARVLEEAGTRPQALVGCDVIGPDMLRFFARLPAGVRGRFRLVRWPVPEASWADRYDLSGVVAVRGDVLLRYADVLEPGRPFDTVAALRQLLREAPEEVLSVDAPLRLLFDWDPYDGTGPLPSAPPPPSVSVIIPYRDRPDLMRDVLGSLAIQEGLERIELVLVDNQSDPDNRSAVEQTCGELMPSAPIHHLRYDHPFNHSAQSNMGAEAATGDVLLFLNNDARLRSPDVLARLAGWAMQPDVASAGPRFVDTAGELLSAGFEIYGDDRETAVVRESKARILTDDVRRTVGNSFACAAVSRPAWERIGPLDAQTFPADSNDADFAVRALSKGLRHIYVGDVEVVHAPGSSGRRDADKTMLRDLMRERHGDLMNWRDQAPRVAWRTKRIATPFRAAVDGARGRNRLLVALLAVLVWPLAVVGRTGRLLLRRADDD